MTNDQLFWNLLYVVSWYGKLFSNGTDPLFFSFEILLNSQSSIKSTEVETWPWIKNWDVEKHAAHYFHWKRFPLAKHLGIPLYCHLTIASAASTSASASRLPFQQHLRRESRECSQASHLMVNGRISWSDQRNLLSGDAFDEQIHSCTDSDVKHCQISDLLYISS